MFEPWVLRSMEYKKGEETSGHSRSFQRRNYVQVMKRQLPESWVRTIPRCGEQETRTRIVSSGRIWDFLEAQSEPSRVCWIRGRPPKRGVWNQRGIFTDNETSVRPDDRGVVREGAGGERKTVRDEGIDLAPLYTRNIVYIISLTL